MRLFHEHNQDGLAVGSLYALPNICRKNKDKCKHYYNRICEVPGIHRCPYGFSSLVTHRDVNGVHRCYTALCISGYVDKARIKTQNANFIIPMFPPSIIINFAACCEQQERKEIDDSVRINELESREAGLKSFIEVVLHEMRKINARIKSASETSMYDVDHNLINPDRLKDRLHNIVSNSELLSVRLNSYDFEMNPDFYSREERSLVGIYKKFEKSMHCLKTLANERGIKLRLNGQSHFVIDSAEVFDLLPFTLLENAIEYSPSDQLIEVNFSLVSDGLSVVVESVGPRVDLCELSLIANKYYRSKSAKRIRQDGTGLGLYIAKNICDHHQIDISFASEGNIINMNDCEYCFFKAKLHFPSRIIRAGSWQDALRR